MMGTAAHATRVAKLERPQRAGEREGVVVMPAVLPLDAWEALAVASQQRLANSTRAGVVDKATP